MDEEKVEQEKEKPRARPKLLKVRVVERRGDSVLAERTVDGDLQRKVIPASELIVGRDRLDVKVGEGVWDAGIAYGVEWDRLLKLEVTNEDIARAWRGAGIWTLADLKVRWNDARQIVMGLCKPALVAALQQATKEADNA